MAAITGLDPIKSDARVTVLRTVTTELMEIFGERAAIEHEYYHPKQKHRSV